MSAREHWKKTLSMWMTSMLRGALSCTVKRASKSGSAEISAMGKPSGSVIKQFVKDYPYSDSPEPGAM